MSELLSCCLSHPVKSPPESLWILERGAEACEHPGSVATGAEVHLLLQKAVPGQVWRGVFEGHGLLSESQVVQIEGDLHLEQMREVNPLLCLNQNEGDDLPHARYLPPLVPPEHPQPGAPRATDSEASCAHAGQ